MKRLIFIILLSAVVLSGQSPQTCKVEDLNTANSRRAKLALENENLQGQIEQLQAKVQQLEAELKAK